MKIGFNEATALKCKGQSLIADLEVCEQYGYDYIEIRSDCIKAYLKEHRLEELAAWFKNHTLKPWAYNTLLFFNLRDQAGVKEIDNELDFIITVSDAIGMKLLNTVPAFDVPPLSIEAIKQEAVSRLRYIADKVAPHGIKVSLEFCGSPNCSINQFGTAYDVIETVNRANVGITMDAFQFHAMDSHWEDLAAADGKKIFIFHINDIENLPIGSIPDGMRLWPGDGCLDHERILKLLRDIGFDGVSTVEVIRPEYYELSHADNVRIAKEKTAAVLAKYAAW
jgi:2-keto-myo-inositol isomerase